MGFRNSIASTLSTSDGSGRRILISSDEADRIQFFTGDPGEASQGRMYVGISPGESSTGGDRGFVFLAPPELGGNPGAAEAGIQVLGQRRDGSSPGQITANGDFRVQDPVGPTSAANREYVDAVAANLDAGSVSPGVVVPTGGASQSGFSGVPALPSFYVGQPTRAIVLAGFRVQCATGAVGLLFPCMDGNKVGPGEIYRSTLDETRQSFGAVTLAAGNHTPGVRVESFPGGAGVTWTSSWVAVLLGPTDPTI